MLVILEWTYVRISPDFSAINGFFLRFLAVFCTLGRQEAVEKKAISGIDRARRALSVINIAITGIGCWTNRTWKYWNRARRYPTSFF